MKEVDNIKFLMHGSGETTENVMNFNWGLTSMGAIDRWPVTLQSSLSICLNSNFPTALYWGKELVLIYNDAWSPIPGNKHPWRSVGQHGKCRVLASPYVRKSLKITTG
jgi:hypothetical protein